MCTDWDIRSLDHPKAARDTCVALRVSRPSSVHLLSTRRTGSKANARHTLQRSELRVRLRAITRVNPSPQSAGQMQPTSSQDTQGPRQPTSLTVATAFVSFFLVHLMSSVCVSCVRISSDTRGVGSIDHEIYSRCSSDPKSRLGRFVILGHSRSLFLGLFVVVEEVQSSVAYSSVVDSVRRFFPSLGGQKVFWPIIEHLFVDRGCPLIHKGFARCWNFSCFFVGRQAARCGRGL